MENFDKIKVFITKCIRREYPNSKVTFNNDDDKCRLSVQIFKESTLAKANCVDKIQDILKLCNIKNNISISVNGQSALLIRLKCVSEGLGTLRMFRNGDVAPVYDVYELPTPIIDGIYRDPIACNTDPICQ